MRYDKVTLILAILLVSGHCLEAPPEDSEEDLDKVGADYLRRVISKCDWVPEAPPVLSDAQPALSDRLQIDRSEGQQVELSEMGDYGGGQMMSEMPANYVTVPTRNMTTPMQEPSVYAEVIPSSSVAVPNIPPGLTLEELTAIYNAAVTKVANMPELHSPVGQPHHPPPPASPTKTEGESKAITLSAVMPFAAFFQSSSQRRTDRWAVSFRVIIITTILLKAF